ncbi:hypothetical protein BT96DRAFT_971050 [Gymnopus androsaceus JB14]|uniref:F-box domain-containing protein n=1 Tax=Gymnopus androsaceus JB14 TaxID=1447944 RepID=A0A6A4IBI6_9AGAR|nr:hypothetical protein BT96DRAFT_971050 [Gymnopus androsaceus JB14]
MTLSFFHLPVELVCHVLCFLSVKDLLQCNLIARRLRRIINDSSALQYTIELARARMLSAIPLNSEPSFSLRMLREREHAFRTLSVKSRHKLKLAHSGTVYEFTGGTYGIGKETDRRTTKITFYDLPSVESGEQRNLTYTFSEVDNIIDFTMDPAQDLLVLLSLNQNSPYLYDLHLRTLSTNEPHPNAPTPTLQSFQVREGFDGTEGAVRIQVSGGVVGFLIKETSGSMRGHFEVFKWRTPSPNSCALNCFSGIDDFTFLSEDHFLLVRPNGLLEVYNFSDPISDPVNPAMRARYALPILSDAYSFWYLSLNSNPSPGYFPGPAGERKTYYSSPEDRLLACCVYVFQPAFTDRDTVYPFVFFFRAKTFLNPPPEWRNYSENVDINVPFPWTSSNSARAITTPSPPASTSSNGSSPSFSSSPSPSESDYAPSPSSVPSSASSVSLDGSSHDLLNFPEPQATYAGPSSMLLNISPSSSGRITPPRSSRNHSPILPIPWEVWGPQSTRWFRECLSKDWQHSIYGLRTVDCVLDRAGLDSLIHREDAGKESVSSDDDSVNEDNDGEDSDAEDFVFINDVAISAGDIESSHMGRAGPLPKFLRVRDFNPYSVSKATEELAMDVEEPPSPPISLSSSTSSHSHLCDGQEVSHDIVRDRGGYQRVVTGPSKVNVRGVFRKNIVSCLPYVEVVSEDTFSANEVMLDDCRLLLLKRGRRGKLKSINILTI